MGTTRRSNSEALLEQAAQEAEGIEVFGQPLAGIESARAREEAQGVEVFSNPDAEVPLGALVEGPPGQETLDARSTPLDRAGEADRGRDAEDDYE